MNNIITILVIHLFVIQFGISQDNNSILDALNIIAKEKSKHNHGISIFDISNTLKKHGVKVEPFCVEVLNKKELVDYKSDAITLLAAEKYEKEPGHLANILTDYYQNTVLILGEEYVSKTCLYHISKMVGPHLFKEEVIPIITSFYTRTFEGMSINGYKLNDNHSLDRTKTINSNKYSGMPQRLILGYLSLTANLYQATGNEKYKNRISFLKESNDPVVVNMCKFYLSDTFKEGWVQGRYELFAHERGLIKERNLPNALSEDNEKNLQSSRNSRNREYQ